ncbi:ABC transporter ATP-binding protein [Zunongwangia profunda]|uniref:ABC-type transporter ATP-binding protein n=2 Tax=Zunongwangia profunda TaxID=398743 RepID=D5BM84_ZUNPS|nr:ATP-binding cassette domain-containing protein [Zunongwangia profunda]MAC64898.1 ABC transporter ATP-binding protein [Flavobacteriaceae bacterium]MAS72219.1 ABC transporter ATP-binding protein [Zunongwangia sp.]ADF54224.1 ABC-type transporter ATP-binding protein [Zunongwangia profunda SM-A87]MAG87547.1 ABC transporter ATP-binding protein [Flavobacteriaceae bacterium]HAJ81304.1 ABC transporter ATP-binding protein [Zunongwangia profunda]|tara:strand:- start:11887 stop:12651 length:765 start_codon:yes stop_codon:yes gene_type:complete
MIEVKNLRKAFNGEEVLKGLNFVFDRGKTNLIIGQSGSGKSVFLKNMLGIFTPEEGTIEYDGKPYSEFTDEERRELRKEIGMVFQGGALFDSMTVKENVMFPLKMFTKMKKAEMEERVDNVLERVNLVGADDKMPSEISGGMQKRVSIARAIVNRPKYLFCDEPNSGLDPTTATVIDNLIQKITHEFDITTIIITHDMNSVLEIGEKIAFLKDGLLAWTGTKDEIFKTQDKTVTDFVYSSDLFKKVRKAQLKGY